MEVRATGKFLRFSPTKGRYVAALIKGKKVGDAQGILKFSPRGCAPTMKKILDSALANAGQKEGVDVDTLFVKNVIVDGGPMLKRIRFRAMGRANRIMKRTCHVTVILDEKQ
jgi:large subunit ribosomal protein L22